MSRENSLKNLRPIKKGEVRNKWGRYGKNGVTKASVKAALVKLLEGDETVELESYTKSGAKLVLGLSDAVAATLLSKALKGDLGAIKEVKEWIDGLETESIVIEDALTKEQRDAAVKALLATKNG